jgi:nitrogenase delta subunit
MSSKLDELFGYVQERCLWQFFSRTWDRQENIDGILATATDLLAGEKPKLDTPMDRLFYADAKVMVSDFRARFPWLSETPPQEIRELIAGLKARLEDIAIAGSKNRELSHHLY